MQGSDILIGYFHFPQQLHPIRIAGATNVYHRSPTLRGEFKVLDNIYIIA